MAEGIIRRPKSRAYRTNAVRRTHDLKQAEQWLAEGLQAAPLTHTDLPKLKGKRSTEGGVWGLLLQGTTVSQVWLAERLAMRSAANVSQQLRRVGTEPIKGNLPKRLAFFVERAFDQG